MTCPCSAHAVYSIERWEPSTRGGLARVDASALLALRRQGCIEDARRWGARSDRKVDRMTTKGDRIVLSRTSDPYTRLRPGALGTVLLVDALGTVHVAWDEGSTLGLVPGEDSWRTLDRERDAEIVADRSFAGRSFVEGEVGTYDGHDVTSDADGGL